MSPLLPVLAVGALLLQPPASRPEPATLTLTPQRVFADARAAYRDKPLAERVGVKIVQKGQTPADATLTLRIAPGKTDDQADAAISIDAGDLRISIDNGHITAILASQPATYYQADFTGPPTLTALSEALGALPLPQLAMLTGSSSDLLPAPTLHTTGIVWTPVKVLVDDLTSPITLFGTNNQGGAQGTASISFDQHTARLTKFSATLPALPVPPNPAVPAAASEPRMLEIITRTIEPGDPKTWVIDTSKRSRVASIRDLPIKPVPPKTEPPPAPAPSPTPESAKPVAEPGH